MENMMTLTEWEKVDCSRCGGTGSYSYCSQYGTTCFKCGGQKQVLTARGAAAVAWLAEQRKTRISDLQVGMRVKEFGYSKPLTILEIKVSGSQYMTPEGYKPYTDLVYASITCGHFPESTVEAVPASEEERVAQVRAAIAYQNTLTKAGKPRARKAA